MVDRIDAPLNPSLVQINDMIQQVNAELAAATSGSQPESANLTSIADLDLSGETGNVLAVNGAEDGFELVAAGGGGVSDSIEANITATGVDASDAYVLTATVNIVSAGAAGTGVKLPHSSEGKTIAVMLQGGAADPIAVYVTGDDAITVLAGDQAGTAASIDQGNTGSTVLYIPNGAGYTAVATAALNTNVPPNNA